MADDDDDLSLRFNGHFPGGPKLEKNHIEYMYDKLLRLVGIFYKIHNKLLSAILKVTYFALVHSDNALRD